VNSRHITIGVDIGTTGTKVIAFNSGSGAIVATSRESALLSSGPGIAEADCHQWLANVLDGITEVLASPEVDPTLVGAISTTGMVPAVVILGADGNPLRRAILQNDSRAVVEIDVVRSAVEGSDPLGSTGSAVTQQSVAPTIMWLRSHEPDTLREMRYIVGGYDWILMALGARPHVEQNWAIESGLYRLTGDPFTPAREVAQVADAALPPVENPGSIVGMLRADYARQLGLAADVALVVGGADHVLSAYSAGVRAPGDWLVKLGGAGDILIASPTPLTDARLYLDAHPIKGLWLPNGCMATSGSLIRWFQALIGDVDLTVLDAEASEAPVAANFCVPYFLGEKSPLHDPDLRGAFAGLHLGTSRGELYRSVLESIAFGFRHHADVFRDLGVQLERAMVTNGGSKSTLWKQIHADVLGTPLNPIVDHPGASLGAAVIAAFGVDQIDSLSDIDRYVTLGPQVLPNPDRSRQYDDAYAAWRTFADALTPTSHYLARRATP